MPKETGLSLKDLFLLLGVILVIWFLFQIPTALFIFGTGFVLFFVFDPIIEWLEKIYQHRAFWVTIVIIILLLLVVVAFALLAPLLFKQLKAFIHHLPLYIDWLNQAAQKVVAYLGSYFGPLEIPGKSVRISLDVYINTAISQFNEWAVNSLQNSFKIGLRLFSNIFNFLFAVVIAIYLLIDKKRIRESFSQLLPESFKSHEEKIVARTLGILSGYIRALLFLGFLIFIISWPVLLVLRVPYAFLLALWLGLTEMIPYLGPWIGSITAVVVAWFVSPWLGCTVGVFLLLLQFAENAILVPKVMGSELGIHPLWVLFAMFAGAEIYGLIGMVVAVPLAAVLYAGYRYYRENF